MKVTPKSSINKHPSPFIKLKKKAPHLFGLFVWFFFVFPACHLVVIGLNRDKLGKQI